MKYTIEESNYTVMVTAINFDVGVAAEAPLEVSVGEAARIDVGEAITYIKSGTNEIAAAVESGKADFDANAAAKQALIEEAAATAQYYAENVQFGMVPEYFTAADWVLSNGKYQLSYQYDVVTAVYKKNGDNYELMTNIDIMTGNGTVTIVSSSAFEGYVLLVNSAENMSDKSFVFEQAIASDTWQITHNLNKKPSVTVVDTADNVIYPAVQYINDNSCVVTFNAATKGKAYLN